MMNFRSNHIILVLYILFIVYGSLFPLADWRTPEHQLIDVWRYTAENLVSRSDLLTNLLVYIPFGFLLYSVLSEKFRIIVNVLFASILGAFFSFLMEYLQMYLPARTSSSIDLALNTFGTFLGAMACIWMGKGSGIGKCLSECRHKYVHEGRVADIGLMVLILWGAAQLSPFVPSIDFGDIKNGLKLIWLTIHDPVRFNYYRAVSYALSITSLGMVVHLIYNNSRKAYCWLGLYCGTVLMCKVFVVGRQLSLEALIGLISGVLATAFLEKLSLRKHVFAGGVTAAVSFIAEELRPDYSQIFAFHEFNWIPFKSQMAENVAGIGSILDNTWPFSAIGFFLLVVVDTGSKISYVLSAVSIMLLVFVIEYMQTAIIGRYPDITTVILSCVGFLFVWISYRAR